MKTRPTIIFVFTKPQRLLNIALTTDSPGIIYCRITVRGQRTVISTGIHLTYGEWNTDAGRVVYRPDSKLSKTAVKQANEQIIKMLDQLTDIAADLHRQGKPVTAQAIVRTYHSGGSVLSMLQLFETFQQERGGLIDIEIAKASFAAAKSRYGILNDFLAAHRLTDLRPEEFNHNMADKMLYWCLKERGYKRNYTNKILQTMSQVLRWGVRREHLGKNPMEMYQFKSAAPDGIKYLGVDELAALSVAALPVPCLERVRDCFVFQCWTGLAYADVAALNVAASAEYHKDKAGNARRVLRITRAKSTVQKGYECVIPLLPEAERILALYSDKLPLPSNQIYNRYLKQVGELCGIEVEKCTSHVGRKTAGVMMLNAGIRMETVSKFLGHSSVRMTEKVYAKILDTTVVDDFSGLFGGTPAVVPPLVPYELPAPTAAPVVLRPARRMELKGGAAL